MKDTWEGWNAKLRFKDLVLLLVKYLPALPTYITEVKLNERKMNNFLL